MVGLVFECHVNHFVVGCLCRHVLINLYVWIMLFTLCLYLLCVFLLSFNLSRVGSKMVLKSPPIITCMSVLGERWFWRSFKTIVLSAFNPYMLMILVSISFILMSRMHNPPAINSMCWFISTFELFSISI